MDLIERYLHAVKSHLQLKQQDDVVAELADDLRSRIDDREAELGRPLQENEVAGILKALGRPLVLASRYSTRQVLIGQALLPYYWQTLKAALAIALGVHVLLAVTMLISGEAVGRIVEIVVKFPFVTAPTLFGWLTLVFALLDRNLPQLSISDSWDPRTLPAVPRDGQARSRVPVVGDMVGLGVLAAWWLIVPAHPFFLPAKGFLIPGPGWHASYLPVAGLMVLALGVHSLALISPALRLPTRLVAHAISLVGIAVLATSGDLLVPVATLQSPERLAHLIEMVDKGVAISLGIAALITLIEMGRDLWRMAQRRRPPVVSAAASTPPGSPR